MAMLGPQSTDPTSQQNEPGVIACGVKPGQRCPKIRMFGFRSTQPGNLIEWLGAHFPGLLHQLDAPIRMTVTYRCFLAALPEFLLRKFADGFQHGEAWFAIASVIPSQQPLFAQRRHLGDQVSSLLTQHCFRRCEGASTVENGKSAKESLFSWGEQIVAPGDRIAHRLLATREIASAPG